MIVGNGTLPTGFEQVILGLKAGDRRSCVLPAAQAFGLHAAQHVRRFLRTEFVMLQKTMDMPLAVGVVISFADPSHAELPGVVVALDEQWVQVDFNHPLAGRDLLFEVEILRLLENDEQPVQLTSVPTMEQGGANAYSAG